MKSSVKCSGSRGEKKVTLFSKTRWCSTLCDGNNLVFKYPIFQFQQLLQN